MVGMQIDELLTTDEHAVAKTKIICTLGPRSREVPILENLLRAGMSVARFNFSHGSHDYHQETLDNLRTASANTGIMCAVLLDTKGPEIRTGFLKDGKAVQLKKGREVTITTDYEALGDENTIAMSYKSLPNDVKPGGQILCADGSITLNVLSCNPKEGTVQCRCENTAILGERKNVNLPGVIVDLPTITAKDEEDIMAWGVPNRVDFIAASFVRKGSDLGIIRKLLGPQYSKSIQIISKVENQEGLVNFDDILRESDGIMVARGDLGMEIPIEKIFLAQKMMIHKCNAAGKPVVTATQMLESMTKSPRPTRAEATDVANAVLDGTDAVMLSGETAAGSWPVEAVTVMARICREAEASLDYHSIFKTIMAEAAMPMSPLESLASSAVRTANKARAVLIIVLTRGGSTAKLVAKYRPPMPILSVAVPVMTSDDLTWSISDESPARHALVCRGLVPLLAEGAARATDSDTTDELISAALKAAKVRGFCREGESVVALHRIGNAAVIKIISVK
ncbi:hypothetical protein CLOM_g6810 [Closterium sp. NIES-68]|nr:hypothetical protein CLOM_g6810 [Closterium sp. NIES-68]GJP72343.1 hypothetical protein CLOP_g3085 [Closterium sp. NIES-67]